MRFQHLDNDVPPLNVRCSPHSGSSNNLGDYPLDDPKVINFRFTSINCDKVPCLAHSEHGAICLKFMQNQRFAAGAASAHLNVQFPHYFSGVNKLLWEILTI